MLSCASRTLRSPGQEADAHTPGRALRIPGVVDEKRRLTIGPDRDGDMPRPGILGARLQHRRALGSGIVPVRAENGLGDRESHAVLRRLPPTAAVQAIIP